MLTDEQIEKLSTALSPLFNELEYAVISDIARRILKTTELTRTAELQAIQMQKLGFSPAKIRADAMALLQKDKKYQQKVIENTIASKQFIKEKIAETVKQAQEEGDKLISKAGEMSWIDDMRVWNSNGIPLTDNGKLSLISNAYKKRLLISIADLSRTTAFKNMFGYTAVENLYRTELNKAIVKITTGTFSTDQVIKETVHDLAHSGLRTVDYASGHSMQLESAVKLAVRTSVMQLNAEVTNQNIRDTGTHLVYVSTHWGARNKGTGCANHMNWQGKVYSIGDFDESENDRVGYEIKDLYEVTGYSFDGTKESNPLGLYGYNCRHRIYPWFEGVSEKPDEQPEPKQKTINGREYSYTEMEQRQRTMERNIRNLKREKEALASIGEDTKEIQAKIKIATAEYNEFSKKCGIPTRPDRLVYRNP